MSTHLLRFPISFHDGNGLRDSRGHARQRVTTGLPLGYLPTSKSNLRMPRGGGKGRLELSRYSKAFARRRGQGEEPSPRGLHQHCRAMASVIRTTRNRQSASPSISQVLRATTVLASTHHSGSAMLNHVPGNRLTYVPVITKYHGTVCHQALFQPFRLVFFHLLPMTVWLPSAHLPIRNFSGWLPSPATRTSSPRLPIHSRHLAMPITTL